VFDLPPQDTHAIIASGGDGPRTFWEDVEHTREVLAEMEQTTFSAVDEGLTALTDDMIGAWKAARKLCLNYNKLRAVPQTIRRLTELRQLSFACNEILRVPDELGALRKLQRLVLSHNRLDRIPPGVLTLPALKDLVLDHNRIRSFDASMVPATLEKLDLSSNSLTVLHPGGGNAGVADGRSLRVLNVRGNQIARVDPSIAALLGLEVLVLDENELTELPAPLCEVKSLRQLSVRRNQLTRLPADLSQLENLERFNADENAIEEVIPLGALSPLENIKSISMRNNGMEKLAEELRRMRFVDSLQSLNLAGNFIHEVPGEFFTRETAVTNSKWESVFDMTKEEYEEQPEWRKLLIKEKAGYGDYTALMFNVSAMK